VSAVNKGITKVNFVMETHVGLRTYYENLRRYIDADTRIMPSWSLITYEAPHAWMKRRLFPQKLRGTLNGSVQVFDALRTNAADIVFFNTQVPAVLGGALTFRRPYVLATDITPIQYDRMAEQYKHKADRNGPVKWLKHESNLRVIQHAACLLPWSSWVKESLCTDYGARPELISVTPPGIDLSLWLPKSSYATAAPFKLLFVGGDFERKGGKILLEAFRQLPAGMAELHIVTRSAVPRSERVHVYDNLNTNSPDLIALYHACDIFVLPTLGDSQAIVCEEASATGLPVIVTRMGGLTDVVIDGENRFSCPAWRCYVISLKAEAML